MGSSLSDIREQFMACFGRHGYKHEPAAQISSGIDPTVIFVGSNVSSFKKYILGDIPEEGVMVDQPSMRFREIGKLFDPDYTPFYGSFFNEVGAITPYTKPEQLAGQLREYLTGHLGLQDGDLVARTSSKDPDLLAIARGSFANLETDTKPDKYYRHAIGEEGFVGRNFNVAVRNSSNGKFEDIGNFLAFQRDGKDSFLEVALGDTVIQRSVKGYEHVLDCYGVQLPQGLNRTGALNFTNAVIVTTVLYREGLRASNRNNQERILSKYLRYLSLLKQNGKVGYDDVKAGVASFEQNYYGTQSGIGSTIASDMESKEAVFRKTLTQQQPVAK